VTDTAHPEIAIRNDEGQVILRLGLVCDLYFEQCFDLEVRQRIGRCFEEYRMRYAGLRLVGLPPEPTHWRKIDPPRIQAFHEWLRTGRASFSWFTHWHGGRSIHEASDYQFGVLACEDLLSFLCP
jgi:hypothetical protein